MISEEQIETFFTSTLAFPNWKEELEKNKLDFLKALVLRYGYQLHFHNIHMASVSPADRRTPTLEEVIEIGLGGRGGVCVHQNAFLTYLLKEIGFETFMVAGCFEEDMPDTHVICIVRLSESETYLFDIGCSLPLDEPVPLHQLPYSAQAAGYQYGYRYSEPKKQYQRWQLGGGFFQGDYKEPGYEEVRYVFTLEPRDYSFFQNSLHDIFTNPKSSAPFLKQPFLFRYLDQERLGGTKKHEGNGPQEVGRRFILVYGSSLAICDNLNREPTFFQSLDEIKPKILEYFPKVDLLKFDIAMSYFKDSEQDQELPA